MITELKNQEIPQCRTDTAYTSAVERLRSMLVPKRAPNMATVEKPSTATGAGGGVSLHLLDGDPDPTSASTLDASPRIINEDVLQLIEKQFLYINQLELETANNGQELISILEKVEEVVMENEALHERLKSGSFLPLPTTGQTGRDLFLTELEAKQLQSARSLRLAQEEVLTLRRQLEGQPRPPLTKFPICELHVAEIDNISKERNDLVQTVGTLQQSLHQFKEREKEATEKVKSSLELVEQMRREKTKHESEANELKKDVTHLNERIRQLITETSQKLLLGKSEAEKSCASDMIRLKAEYHQEMESSMKLRLDLDASKRLERELKTSLGEKEKSLAEVRQQMQLKIDTIQAHLSQTLQQKTRTQTDLMNLRLEAEKIERQWKQEALRLNTELSLVRNKLGERESDLKKSADAIRILNQRISESDRSLALADQARHDRETATHDQIMKVTAEAVQQKYVTERRVLDGVIAKQNVLMDKLRGECYQFAQKLEEASAGFKKEIGEMVTENTRLQQWNGLAEKRCKDLEQKVQFYEVGQEQMMNRLHSLESQEKAHVQKIVTLAKKQRMTQIEKERLEGEVAILKSQSQLLTPPQVATL